MAGEVRAVAPRRYEEVAEQKAAGATYTPEALADFVASQMVGAAELEAGGTLRVLDPAIGDGELVLSLLKQLVRLDVTPVVTGFDINVDALEVARERIRAAFPNVEVHLEPTSFLDFVLAGSFGEPNLFEQNVRAEFDLVIANPPYVRTQIIGAEQSQAMGRLFNLSGRIDLYHAFLMGIAGVLSEQGTAGIIVSNRFMTTKAGADVRAGLLRNMKLQHVWDLGDTKPFGAAVLPAVIVARGCMADVQPVPRFTAVYETRRSPTDTAADPFDALAKDGVIAVADGRRFEVKQGILDRSGGDNDIWRVATPSGNDWMKSVEDNSWGVFRDIGKVRVGVKTCADKVFIRADWPDDASHASPELLRPLITHHSAGRFRAIAPRKDRAILYPHEVRNGKRQAVDLTAYPRSAAYLEQHRAALESRSYVLDAGRRWYELWVPQDPEAWPKPKLVFRDISERPTFWVDLEGGVVNGDCYWMTVERDADMDLLWLAAAVANSTFIEAYYDRRFNNKLYAGRRRFITQYVELFPLPNPAAQGSRQLIELARKRHETLDQAEALKLEAEMDEGVWQAFGLPVEEVSR